jgi:catechol 2,3-dioxygenase
LTYRRRCAGTTEILRQAQDDKSGKPIDPGVHIGHVHLKVAELERALAFYVGVLG